MLYRQMTCVPALNDASIASQSLSAKPIWAIFMKSTILRTRRRRPYESHLPRNPESQRISPWAQHRLLVVLDVQGKTTWLGTTLHARYPLLIIHYSNEGFSDKENAPATGEPEGLKNPKRRNNPKATGGASRVVSQEVRSNDNRILSPKSLNSRTYPQSPFRTSPEKGQPSYLSRPTSPLKPSSPLRAAGPGSRPRGATTSTVRDGLQPSQPKKTTARSATGPRAVKSPLPRPATRQGDRRNSNGSTASSGTTVTKTTRAGAGTRKATAGTASATKKPAVPRNQTASLAVKKTAASAASVRKTTAPAAAAPEATGRGTRALRKRV